MSEFNVGDRVVRTGPHLLTGDPREYVDECALGDIGVVDRVYPDGDVTVHWEAGKGAGSVSAIISSSLSFADSHAADLAVNLESMAKVTEHFGLNYAEFTPAEMRAIATLVREPSRSNAEAVAREFGFGV